MLVLLAALAVQGTPPPATPAPIDCNDAAHRAYDFFVGDWDVFATSTNTRIAHSRIEKALGGCTIHETFDQNLGPRGRPVDYHGRSYTAFDTVTGKWRQFYVDSGGTAAVLTGGIEGVAMVLNGSDANGANKMTVAPQPDGSVRQNGVASSDGGKSWQPTYDFTYRRRATG